MLHKGIDQTSFQRPSGKLGHRGSAAAPACPKPGFEALEPRLLLSAVDLTTAGASGWLSGAGFAQANWSPTGSGVIQSFVRMQAGPHSAIPGVEQGYNTDARPVGANPGVVDPVLVDVDNSPFTRDLLLEAVPVVNVGGRLYREFALDINENVPAKAGLQYLSLDELRIFLGSEPDLYGYPDFGGEAYKVFDLGEGNWIKLNYDVGMKGPGGSGWADMIAYIPDELFTGPNEYVYLYSKFGAQGDAEGLNWNGQDGFEEWFVSEHGSSMKGEIHGYKFEDHNGDGVRDPEDDVLQDWFIYLDANDDGQWQPGETSTRTDEQGEYHFYDLVGGSLGVYNVREVLPQDFAALGIDPPPTGNWMQTTGNPSPISFTDDGQVYVAYNGQVALEPGQTQVIQEDLAIGNFQLITISGIKFHDLAWNHQKDPGDPGLTGWTIELYKDDGDGVFDPLADDVIDSAVTDANGDYVLDGFDDLGAGPGIGPGTYFVAEVPQLGWEQTLPQSPNYYTVAPTSGQDVAEMDFGNWPGHKESIVDIYGFKFEDTNVNGSYDDGEPKIPGWPIELYLDGNGDGIAQPEELIGEALTDQDGIYFFLELNGQLIGGGGLPLAYLVREGHLDNWQQTTDDPGAIWGEPELRLTFVPSEGFVEVEDPELERVMPELAFGNVEIVPGDARTLGFWGNKNGQKLITQDDLEALNALNLRNADGSLFTFDLSKSLASNKQELRSWLREGTATNMANMLSVQLAAMQLNLSHGDVTGVTGTSQILVTNPDGSLRAVAVADLIDETAEVLAARSDPADPPAEYLLVMGGDIQRPYFDSLKNALDDANNNLNWIAP